MVCLFVKQSTKHKKMYLRCLLSTTAIKRDTEIFVAINYRCGLLAGGMRVVGRTSGKITPLFLTASIKCIATANSSISILPSV